jgi:hypothetical protein
MEHVTEFIKVIIQVAKYLLLEQIRIHGDAVQKPSSERVIANVEMGKVNDLPPLPSSSLNFRIDVMDGSEIALAVSVIETLGAVHVPLTDITCGSSEYRKASLSAKKFGFRYLFHRIIHPFSGSEPLSSSSSRSHYFVSSAYNPQK